MRDELIRHIDEASAKRAMLMLRQFEFLETRLAAFESILFGAWRERWKALTDRDWLKREIDLRQTKLLQDRDREMQQAQEKNRIIKPKVVSVGR